MSSYRCVDLHSHSSVSDGVLGPAELARRAAVNGVDLWSLTDHDEVGGVALARKTAQSLGIEFVAGVEISVTWASRTVHIVGLGVDETSQSLLNGLEQTRSGRKARGQQMAEKLAHLGMPGAYEGALALAGNDQLLSRTHFARYLVDAGYAPGMQAVFDKYLGDDGVAHVPVRWAELEQAVQWIRDAGGVAVLAHPGRYKYTPNQFDALFREFKECGGVGIEVHTGSHLPHQFREYAQVARDYGLLASCGSDFHGPQESRHDLGSLPALPPDLEPVWSALDFERRSGV